MALKFDHVVIVADSLAEAVHRYEAAGFTVTPGGRHDAIPTENALIAFADGTYLELLALRDPDAPAALRALRAGPKWDAHVRDASAVGRRFLPLLAGRPGVADVVLVGTALERRAREWRRAGLVVTGPVAMSRERPDGETLAWELLLPADPRLPFLIEDKTPRERRVPSSPEATRHANGATGIASVMVRTPDVPATALEYAARFDATPRVEPGGATRVDLAPGIVVRLEPGEPAGACGATLTGVTTLPDEGLVDGLRTA